MFRTDLKTIKIFFIYTRSISQPCQVDLTVGPTDQANLRKDSLPKKGKGRGKGKQGKKKTPPKRTPKTKKGPRKGKGKGGSKVDKKTDQAETVETVEKKNRLSALKVPNLIPLKICRERRPHTVVLGADGLRRGAQHVRTLLLSPGEKETKIRTHPMPSTLAEAMMSLM